MDPQFPARPFVYVNYAYNHDPATRRRAAVGHPGPAVRRVRPATRTRPPGRRRVVPGDDRVTRLTAVRNADGWVMEAGSELRC